MTAPLQPARTLRGLSYGSTKELTSLLGEVSRLLNTYSKAIQAAAGGHSDSCLLAPVEDFP